MIIESPLPQTEPLEDCALCPRLVDYRHACQAEFPPFWNAPVPAFGDPNAWLAIVGLAPGKHGGNRTGRPFTGEFAGDMLFSALAKFDFVDGVYNRRADDGAKLKGVMIFNAVKCAPPANKPSPEEIRTCRPFLKAGFDALPQIRIILALGEIAHQSAVKANGEKLPKRRFAHGAVHHLLNGRVLIDSYHPSQLNQNTGRITVDMFEGVIGQVVAMG
jgi:uracil-DNA glycosylase